MIARRSVFALACLLAACTMERRGNPPASGTPGSSAAQAPAKGPVDTLKDSTSAIVTTAQFGEAGASRTIPVVGTRADMSQAAELNQSVRLLGSVGPYAFVETSLWENTCGAHGNATSGFLTVDLARGGLDTLLDSAAAAALAAAEKDRIVAAFRADTAAESAVEHPDSAMLTALIPSYAGGRLTLTEQFTAEACYICSDNLWSSYTRSVRLRAAQPPAPLAPWATLPPEIQAAFHILPPDSGAGWSAVAMAPARRDALAHLFGVTAPAGGTEYIVWRRLQGDRFESAWLRGRGTEVTVVGRQPDVWIVAGGRAWIWRTKEQRVSVTPCSKQGGGNP